MTQPLISFITPIYNVETPLINRLLDSIYSAQIDQKLFEILLIDDGSNPPIAPKQLHHSSAENLHFYQQPNKGLGAARNQLSPKAKGKYLYFVDADDYLFTENINTLFEITKQEFDTIIVACQIETLSIIQAPLQQTKQPKQWDSAIQYGKQNHWKGGICRYLFRREMIEKHHLLFPQGVWHEDELYITQALFFAQKIVDTNLTIYAYYKRPNSITQNKSQEAINKRANDRITSIKQLDQWIETLPKLDSEQLYVLHKKRDFLIVDFLVTLSKESPNFAHFIQQYNRLLELNYLYLNQKPYGIKYHLFRTIANHPKLLFKLSPIIKQVL